MKMKIILNRAMQSFFQINFLDFSAFISFWKNFQDREKQVFAIGLIYPFIIILHTHSIWFYKDKQNKRIHEL